MNEVKLLIGGVELAARSGAVFERCNPVSGAVVSRSAAAGPADATAAVEAAAVAFPAWSALGPAARRIESGICHINGPTVHDEAQMPFGGVKASGYGRFGGKAGIDDFTELRWITLQTTPRHYPF